MSFKLSSVAKFFSRASHNVKNDNKNSTPQFIPLTTRKTEKADSKNSGSKISRFFHRLFHSKEKARENVNAEIQSNAIQNPRSLNVKTSSNEFAKLSIDDIIANTPGHIKIPIKSSSDITESSSKENSTGHIGPETLFAELDKRRNFIDSDDGFMKAVADMGSCVSSPQKHFRTFHTLDLQKTLADAFQIYYEEGKLIHEDSFATPGWGYEPTTKSPENLESLKADLKKISAYSSHGQELLQKAMDAIGSQIDRITEERQEK